MQKITYLMKVFKKQDAASDYIRKAKRLSEKSKKRRGISKLKCSQCGYEPKEGEELYAYQLRAGKTKWYCYRCVSGGGEARRTKA